ncbi:MAG: HIT domain-containing protein [Bryobacteraceae bacterium]|nr:HIT domain-containing protein [Bryobacteraceae bacterium]
MDHLWSPWRYRYVTGLTKPSGCIFCAMSAARDDAQTLIVHRARYNFVVLNRYPYTSGHLMVVPFAHVSTLEAAPREALTELILLAQRAETLLRQAYRCAGLNMGFNLGECAGAGVAQHVHFHVVPRWPGDANFMTAVGETRVLPEDLSETYGKLSTLAWGEEPGDGASG